MAGIREVVGSLVGVGIEVVVVVVRVDILAAHSKDCSTVPGSGVGIALSLDGASYWER